jgi:glycosyltransferase involved in cell wall biosynthesis
VRSLTQQLSGQLIDVIHAHHEGGALAGLLLKYLGCTRLAIRTTHVPVQGEWGNTWISRLCRLAFTQWLFPVALDAEVAVSPAYTEKLTHRPVAGWLHRQPHLIYSPIPFDLYESEVRQCIPETSITIGSVGRLTKQKGHYYLIEAMSHVLPMYPQARLVLVGDGDSRLELQEYAKTLGVQDKVHFVGQQNNLAALYRSFDVFVLPSLWEGWPAVLLECIASGVPIVATDIPGNHDIIQHGSTGWLAPAADARMLAKMIIEVLRDPVEATSRAQRAKQILPNFSIKRVAAQHIELYARLAHL